jgi:DNA-binding NtrC family response regulator
MMPRVLVVDRDPDLVLLLAEVLRLSKYSVQTCSPTILDSMEASGDADAIVYACPTSIERGDTGSLRALLVRDPGVRERLILLTTQPFSREIAVFRDRFGPLRILPMPFEIEQLIEAVAECVAHTRELRHHG